MGNKKKTPSLTPAVASLTLREESSGKKHGGVNVKSMLKLDHLKSLANWAAAEAGMPAVGAFFGNRLAASAQELGVPPDPLFFSCQRCESVLQPGSNCTVRIQKMKKKAKRGRKVTTQNSVVYKCHFCLHENLKRGTPKGYMKRLCPPKVKVPPKSGLAECPPVKPSEVDDPISKQDEIALPDIPITGCCPPPPLPEAKMNDDPISKQDETALPDIPITVSFPIPPLAEAKMNDDPISRQDEIALPDIPITGSIPTPPLAEAVSCPTTPVTKVTTLLEMGKRKRNRSRSKNVVEPESSSAVVDFEKSSISSSKRKRKSWTSLKEIAECGLKGSSTIPFLI